MAVNEELWAAMRELGLTKAGLADAVNRETERLTGRFGRTSERTVTGWTSGRTGWPNTVQRVCIETVFDCPSEQLGFTPRGKGPQHHPEQPVRRRTFLSTTAAAAAVVTAPGLAGRRRVGMSDVDALRARLDGLTALDDQVGGHAALERAALDGAGDAAVMQQRPASERVRRALATVEGAYLTTAAWSCVDAREFERAQRHLDRALTLAGLARDTALQLRVWNSTALMAYQQQHYPLALAAAQAAQACGITRRDPLYASLAHARAAVGHAGAGERQAALRSLGHAGDALHRADLTLPRPAWLAFYGAAELDGLASIVHDHLDEPEDAEGACHRSLARLPGQYRRNRAMVTTRLALAQLRQDEVEQACATAVRARELMAGAPLPGRLRSMQGDFHRGLLTAAPDSAAARQWGERIRAERTPTP
ncbi:XRE family transcriptional regulator [Kitasatospora sp. NPDC059160]|uniref:XRE family transcriptional regulator n=1 Tax=Kitasatospora sp. NPDC059160 TaxID=3346748 RepID=UPI00369B97FE